MDTGIFCAISAINVEWRMLQTDIRNINVNLLFISLSNKISGGKTNFSFWDFIFGRFFQGFFVFCSNAYNTMNIVFINYTHKSNNVESISLDDKHFSLSDIFNVTLMFLRLYGFFDTGYTFSCIGLDVVNIMNAKFPMWIE